MLGRELGGVLALIRLLGDTQHRSDFRPRTIRLACVANLVHQSRCCRSTTRRNRTPIRISHPGQKRNRAMVTGLMAHLRVEKPFAQGEVGRVALVVSKDRAGKFKRGAEAAVIELDAAHEPYTFSVEPPGGNSSRTRKWNALDRVLAVVDSEPRGRESIWGRMEPSRSHRRLEQVTPCAQVGESQPNQLV